MDRGGCLARQTPIFPSEMGDKMPRAKDVTEPVGLAMLGCHTVGDYLSDKAMARTGKADIGRLPLFSCEFETYLFYSMEQP